MIRVTVSCYIVPEFSNPSYLLRSIQSIAVVKPAMSSQQRQSTFFRAIGVFVEHSLHVALLQLEKVRSYEQIGGYYSDFGNRGWNTACNLEKLVQFLQGVAAAPLSSVTFGRKLAIIDRLTEAVVWSTEWKCLTRTSQSEFKDFSMYAFSAKMLMFSDASVTKGDEVLGKEWELASQLCEASINHFLTHSGGFAPHHKEDGNGRVGACKTIVTLVETFSALLPGDLQKVVARYKFKQSLAEQELQLEVEQKEVEAHSAQQTDPRLRRLLQHQSAGLCSTIAELRSMYENTATATAAYNSLLNRTRWLKSLWAAVTGMQAAFQAANITPAPTNKPSTATLYPQYQALYADGEKVLDDTAALLAKEALQPSASYVADVFALQKRAQVVTK
jgi:hypothetical protein